MPAESIKWDMRTYIGGKKLKKWIKKNIPQVGDKIFRWVAKA